MRIIEVTKAKNIQMSGSQDKRISKEIGIRRVCKIFHLLVSSSKNVRLFVVSCQGLWVGSNAFGLSLMDNWILRVWQSIFALWKNVCPICWH